MEERSDRGVMNEAGPVGCCEDSGLCLGCDGGPGDCVQTSDVSSLAAGPEQGVGHVPVICGCVTIDSKISSLKQLQFTPSHFLRSGTWRGLAGSPAQGPWQAAAGRWRAEV